MITSKKELNKLIKSDLFRYIGKDDNLSFYKAYFTIPGFKFSYYLRKSSYYNKHSLKGVIFRCLLLKYQFKYGFQITPNTQIGKGFYIGHFGNIIINSKAQIGKNVNISPGVVIGMANRGKLKGYPKLGNQIWIGANAIIIGNITIGNNVLIAPGSYINFNVPDNSIVLGNPGKIIPKESPTSDYINNIVSEEY
ncbi:serine acetyltransferase [Adhaeribacter terreus]|uniref:Serine acetyltransferase n=1 Tax=Adhaeribacter terreus TaxID=529703 RepID=A0ABW0EB68_9BACT